MNGAKQRVFLGSQRLKLFYYAEKIHNLGIKLLVR